MYRVKYERVTAERATETEALDLAKTTAKRMRTQVWVSGPQHEHVAYYDGRVINFHVIGGVRT